ncbi:PrsW family glutamic-type intramembrane protease [Micromonospora sp. HM5-17]|jgi:RsiW-degrading membrane proteinase PrsW (M82 family)|uniref:PrsW family glutamic-type intramembrane protease n=1 Tax=Micromonospora sp. HM5-17 TaxID=2487710 RepID=UPI000F46040B|nr:PrsW family glutamic-type intramembrane protease [Micromonospora sp. HM5-17]ROT29868.1 PrsW family intramembrane metalloprotease [Micromonospora sp. HM5-17]
MDDAGRRWTAAVPVPPRRFWLRVFLVGLALWLATVVVIFLTRNPTLLPTLVLLGSFLVPVTFVTWAFERRDTGEVTVTLVFATFLAGGVLGVLGSAVLESYLLRPSVVLFLSVGLIEEAAKLAALALLTRRLAVKTLRDGMILGAAVGFGFSALESAGYAFIALFTVQGLSVVQVVLTEILRGLVAPVGHGLWTAILGGVLFATSTRDHVVVGSRLLLAYLGVAVLHALWDAMHVIALYLTLLLTGDLGAPVSGTGSLERPTPGQAVLMPVLEGLGLAAVAVLGVVWLLVLWRSGRRGWGRPSHGWRVPTGSTAGVPRR